MKVTIPKTITTREYMSGGLSEDFSLTEAIGSGGMPTPGQIKLKAEMVFHLTKHSYKDVDELINDSEVGELSKTANMLVPLIVGKSLMGKDQS